VTRLEIEMKSLMTLMLALAVTAPAFSETMLYQSANSLSDQKITLSKWGSGIITEAHETSYTGDESIRISTNNLFQGGIIFFGSPTSLAPEYSDKNDLLRLTFKIDDGAATGSGGGVPKGGGGAGAAGQIGGGGAGNGQTISGASKGGSAAAKMKPADLTTLRLVITTSDGLKSETYLPASSRNSSKGWRQIGIPLQAISGFDRTNKTISSIAISGNSTGTFWVGDIRTVVDTSPITGEVSQTDFNLATGDEIALAADGDGGASLLKYTWSFDGSHPDEQDAAGPVIRHKFRKPGDYTITLTISDYFGLKAPFKTQVHVKVN
jgi:hypothetical protein